MKDKCQVCGCSDVEEYEDLDGGRNSRLVCGGSHYLGCMHAERLALERAAEIERLKASHARMIALCRRISALPGDYNLIQDAEFVFRDLRDALASETLTETKPQETST